MPNLKKTALAPILPDFGQSPEIAVKFLRGETTQGLIVREVIPTHCVSDEDERIVSSMEFRNFLRYA